MLDVREIRKAGFATYFFLYMNQFAIGASMDMVLGAHGQGLAHYVREFTPDMIACWGSH